MMKAKYVVPVLICWVIAVLGTLFVEHWSLGLTCLVAFGWPLIWFVVGGIPEGGPPDW